MEKNRVLNQSINQSLTHPAYLVHREPKLSLRNSSKTKHNKLKPGVGAFYAIQPGNGFGLFYSSQGPNGAY